MVFRAYEHGKALHVAEHFEIDDVIDPAATRARFVHALDAAGPRPHWSAGPTGSGGRSWTRGDATSSASSASHDPR